MNNNTQVVFEEENTLQNSPGIFGRNIKPSFLTGILMKLSGGLIKTKKQADIVMVIIFILAVCFIVYNSFNAVDYQEISETYSDQPNTYER